MKTMTLFLLMAIGGVCQAQEKSNQSALRIFKEAEGPWSKVYVDTIKTVYDTIPVIMLVSDSATMDGVVKMIEGYEVRRSYCCDDRRVFRSGYAQTLDYRPVPWYEHHAYLDYRKKAISKTLHVWQAVAKPK